MSDSECKDWRETAKELLNHETIDPMRRDYRGKEADNCDEIVLGDLADIKGCDFLLVNATKPSWGTAMEIVYARFMDKTIVAFTGDSPVSPWLAYHCHTFKTIEQACEAINVNRNPWNNL